MLTILTFLAIAVYAYGAVVSVDRLQALDGRIVGGADADIISYPWHTSIQKGGIHFCGGSVYTKNIIVTAAHCTEGVTPNQLSVRAGSSTWNSGGILIRVAAFKIHDDFIGRSYDIALLRLEKDLTFNSFIRPIALASQEPPTGAPAVVIGWGQRYDGEPARPTVLQYVNVEMIDYKLCASDVFGFDNRVMPSMICAAAPGKDACLDDSGGSLVSGGLVVGIVSFGQGCAEDFYPGIYTNVAGMKSWVDINVKIV